MSDPAAVPTDAPDAATVAADAASPTGHGGAVPAPAGAPPEAIAPLTPPAPASRRTIFKNFASVASIGLVSRAVGIVSDVYVRRTLGPSVVGMMDWNGAALAYASVVTNPGLHTVARRDAAKSPHRAAELLLSTVLLQVGPLALVVALCIACVTLGLRTGLAGQLLVVQAIAGLFAAVQLRWAFEAMDRYVVINLLGLATLVLTTVGNVAIVHAPQDALRTVGIQLLGGAVLSGSTILLAFRHGVISWPGLLAARRPALAGLWPRYREAFPITLAGLSVTLYTTGVTLVLGTTHGDTAVGLYTTAYGLTMLGTVAAATLNTVYFASLTRSGSRSSDSAAVAYDYFRAVYLATAPVGLLGWAGGRYVLQFLYGPAYGPVGPYFEWLCLLLVLIGIHTGFVGPLLPWGETRKYLRITLVGAIANVVLMMSIVPFLGVGGAVATALLTELAALVAAMLVRVWLVPIPLRQVGLSLALLLAVAGGARCAVAAWPGGWPATLMIAAATMGGVIAALFPGLAAKGWRLIRR